MRRRVVIVLAVIAAAAVLCAWASRFPTFRLFFSWPQGSTWSNAIEQAEGALVIALAGYLGRDHIGRALAGWWGRIHPHRDKIDRALAAAEAAHRIAAATHEHLTGERHPDSPPEESA